MTSATEGFVLIGCSNGPIEGQRTGRTIGRRKAVKYRVRVRGGDVAPWSSEGRRDYLESELPERLAEEIHPVSGFSDA
ncbi:unnamed protein product [Arctogadus glacialis]